MGNGLTGYGLEVDLTKGSISKVRSLVAGLLSPDGRDQALETLGRRWRGGKGGDSSRGGVLVFSAGALVGTPVPGACRTTITALSAETGEPVVSGIEGFFGAELKYAGYDELIIKGASKEPVYLYINNSKAELRSAAALAGESAFHTASAIRGELRDVKIQIAAVGPAAEWGCVQASVEHMSSSATGGVGAVMGAKNLKAVAVRGTGSIDAAEPSSLFPISLRLFEQISQNAHSGDLLLEEADQEHLVRLNENPALSGKVQGFWSEGLQKAWEVVEEREHVFEQWENYSQEMEEVREIITMKSGQLRGTGCYNCPKSCHRLIMVPENRKYFLKSYAKLTFAVAAFPNLVLDYDILHAMQEAGLDEFATCKAFSFLEELRGLGGVGVQDLPDYPEAPKDRFLYLIRSLASGTGPGAKLGRGLAKASFGNAGLERSILEAIEERVQAAVGVSDRSVLDGVVDWQKSLETVDDLLGICPLLSSFRMRLGDRPPYTVGELVPLCIAATGYPLEKNELWKLGNQLMEAKFTASEAGERG